MFNSLQDFCTKNICNNLKLNNSIIKLKNWKIPLKTGNSIFSFYSKNVCNIDWKDLEIFHSSTISFSSLTLNKKFYRFPKFFLKIDVKSINELNCFLDFHGYWYHSLKILLKRINNIEILNIFIIFNLSKYKNFETCHQIRDVFNLFYEYLNKNLLIELRIYFSPIYQIDTKTMFVLRKFIRNCRNLKLFHFQNIIIDHVENHFLNDLNLSTFLKDLKIKIPSSFEFLKIVENLHQLNNLKILFIDLLNIFKTSAFDVILTALLRSKSTLEELKILLKIDEFIKNFKFLLKNFQLLKKIIISSTSLSDCQNNFIGIDDRLNGEEFSILHIKRSSIQSIDIQNILDSLKDHHKVWDELVLEEFTFEDFSHIDLYKYINDLSKLAKRTLIFLQVDVYSYDIGENLIYTINNCKNIDFFFSIDFKKDFYCSVLHGIESSQSFNTIRKLRLSEIFIGQACHHFDFKTFFEQFKHLETIDLSCNSLQEIMNKVCQGLLNSTNKLKEINFSNCSLKENNRDCFQNLLRNCSSLEILIIEYNGNFIDEKTLNLIGNYSSNSLMILSLSCSIQFIEEFLNIAKKLMGINRLKLVTNDGLIAGKLLERLSNIFMNGYFYSISKVYRWKRIY